MERYNSLPRIQHRTNGEEITENYSSFKSEKSFQSKSEINRRLYVSKSPLFFKKLSERESKDATIERKMNIEDEPRAIKRMVDINFVLEQSKKRFEVKVNPRLLEKNEPIMKLSAYDNFSPFKRNH